MPNTLILSVLLLTSIFSSAVNANKSPEALSLLNLPIGGQRSTTLPSLEQKWGSQATCNTTRTGVGMTRRAYFLETCVFNNEHGNTLYDEIPATAVYQFLEDRLVQIVYHFELVLKPVKFRRCALKDAKKLESLQSNSNDISMQGISVTEDYQVKVSDVKIIDQIHALQETP